MYANLCTKSQTGRQSDPEALEEGLRQGGGKEPGGEGSRGESLRFRRVEENLGKGQQEAGLESSGKILVKRELVVGQRSKILGREEKGA